MLFDRAGDSGIGRIGEQAERAALASRSAHTGHVWAGPADPRPQQPRWRRSSGPSPATASDDERRRGDGADAPRLARAARAHASRRWPGPVVRSAPRARLVPGGAGGQRPLPCQSAAQASSGRTTGPTITRSLRRQAHWLHTSALWVTAKVGTATLRFKSN